MYTETPRLRDTWLRPATKDTGFTLFELLALLGVLSLVLGMSALSFSELRSQTLLRTTVQQVEQFTTQLARRSTLSGRTIALRYDKQHRLLQAVYRDTTQQRDAEPADQLPLSRLLCLTAFRFPDQTLFLFPTGTLSPGRLTISNCKSASCTITHTLRGWSYTKCK